MVFGGKLFLRQLKTAISHFQPVTVFGVKSSFRKIERVFSIEVRNLKLWEMPKLLNFRLLVGNIFLIVTTLNQN